MKSLSAHMQPMVVQALMTAFQRSLKEELRGAFRAHAERRRTARRDGPARDGTSVTRREVSPCSPSPRAAPAAEAVAVALLEFAGAGDEAGRAALVAVDVLDTPPVQPGKPMPMMEPMLASATEVSTPSSRQPHRVQRLREEHPLLHVLEGDARRPARVKCSRRPGHSPVRLPSSPYS